jgi:hypothetical protein
MQAILLMCMIAIANHKENKNNMIVFFSVSKKAESAAFHFW